MGLQGRVFSDFDLFIARSRQRGYFGGLYSSFRVGRWSAFGRLFHESSHLGDEFLLRTRLQRLNLSYEGGGSQIILLVPRRATYLMAEAVVCSTGNLQTSRKDLVNAIWLEFRSPWRADFGAMRPIVAATSRILKNITGAPMREQVFSSISLQVLDRNLQILVEYFNGHSPSGQFYRDKIEYIGLGAHFHF